MAQTSAETDREALVALYNTTNGSSWKSNTNWLSDRPIGEWDGVTTGPNGRVGVLNLNNAGMVGAHIPARNRQFCQPEKFGSQGQRVNGQHPA